jgi:uncharacterized RDD family membrane protein YckC
LRRDRHRVLRIRTPEGVVFSLLLAGPVSRSMAWLMDVCIVYGAMFATVQAARRYGLVGSDAGEAMVGIAVFVIDIGYFILFEWMWRGRTVGKRLLGLRVADAEGLHLRFRQVLIRNLLRFVDRLPFFYLLGGAMCFFNRRFQRLGDLAAGTVVVRRAPLADVDVERLSEGKFNSLLEHPHLAARLRQRVSPEEASLAVRALLRREALEPAARLRLFEEIAGHFRGLVEFPPEAGEGITDEQYVRNVVGIIYGGRRHRGAGSGTGTGTGTGTVGSGTRASGKQGTGVKS